MPLDSPARVMLVDDSHADRVLFREMLKEIDPRIKLLFAEDGVTAIMHLIADNAELPDMIFLDMNMPRMNGIETLQAIKKYHFLAHIPVVMFSTAELEDYHLMAKKLGATYCLKKSMDMHQGVDEIRIIIEKIMVHNRNLRNEARGAN
jgi:CheY-like chemotaxis protein